MSNLSEQRKVGQQNGEIPDFFITPGYQMFMHKYKHQPTARDQYELISKTIAKYFQGTKFDSDGLLWTRFFDIMWNGYLSPSTPVLSNTGTNRGLSVSCSGQYIGDSIDEFFASRREAAILTKFGFGTSAYLGDIRPRGAPVHIGLKASGTAPLFDGFRRDMMDVAQGAARRGAWAGYLPIDHGDFYEIIELLHHDPSGRNVGWCISDSFISDLKLGSVEALKRYQTALRTKMITGKGYFFFTDKVARHRPDCYVERGLDVKASNLCVAPETLILTDKGHIEISTLEGETVNVWNGSEWSSVKIIKTGQNKELIKVHTDSGQNLECTPQHKFYVSTDYKGGIVEKRAYDLLPGDKLIKLSTPVIEGDIELNHPYANGFYSGDGCYYKGESIIYLYHDKRNLLDKFKDVTKYHNVQEDQNREIIYATGLQHKFFVPNASYSVQSRIDWLSGLLDADGCLLTNRDSQILQIGSVELEFLKEIQLMLQTLGVQSKVDGSGLSNYYSCKNMYRLLISGNGINQLLSLGMKTYRLQITDNVPNRNCERFVVVTDVEQTGRVADTFCFMEPKRHLGVFNGILTGQCTEIMLHSSPEYTYTCIISSMNVAKFDEWKDKPSVLFHAMLFLYGLALDFIEKADKIPGMEKAVAFTKNSMALGLGQCGLHTYFQSKGIPFGSVESQFLNTEIARTIYEGAINASYEIAGVFGEAPWSEGTGLACTHHIAIAPTKSTALIMGGISEGINPDPGVVYTATTAAGEVERITPVFLDLLKKKGKFNEKTIQNITANFGSVRECDFLDDDDRAVFAGGFEIPQDAIIRFASQRQQYVDQGQSINLFFGSDATEEYISSIHQMAFNDPSILSLYYCYSSTNVAGSQDQCVACQ